MSHDLESDLALSSLTFSESSSFGSFDPFALRCRVGFGGEASPLASSGFTSWREYGWDHNFKNFTTFHNNFTLPSLQQQSSSRLSHFKLFGIAWHSMQIILTDTSLAEQNGDLPSPSKFLPRMNMYDIGIGIINSHLLVKTSEHRTASSMTHG